MAEEKKELEISNTADNKKQKTAIYFRCVKTTHPTAEYHWAYELMN